MRFATRIFVGAVTVLVISVVVMLVAADTWLRGNLEEGLVTELETDARLVAEGLPRDATTLNPVAHRFGMLLGRRVTLIGSDGVVLGDSDFDDSSVRLLENAHVRAKTPREFLLFSHAGFVSHRRDLPVN